MLERESGPRREGSAIGLWPNAFRALDALGLAQPLRDAHPLFDRCPACLNAPAMYFGGPSAVPGSAVSTHAATSCSSRLLPTSSQACTKLDAILLMGG